MYDMMNVSTAAIVASGTATLETAIMGLPTVLTYRVSALTYWLAKLLVHGLLPGPASEPVRLFRRIAE